jgi:hypothetical protein
MKLLLAGAALALFAFDAASAQGSHYVQGYTRSNGTYVPPHYQTNPDSTRANNYSTEGNVNPYTGQAGTKPLYPSTPSYGYTPPTYTTPSYSAPKPYTYGAPKPVCTNLYGC